MWVAPLMAGPVIWPGTNQVVVLQQLGRGGPSEAASGQYKTAWAAQRCEVMCPCLRSACHSWEIIMNSFFTMSIIIVVSFFFSSS